MMTGILLSEQYGDLDINPVFDNDGKIIRGLQIGETDYQNIKLLLSSDKGDSKDYPVLGVSMDKYLKSSDKTDELLREIKVQLEAIGYIQPEVTLDDTGKLVIDV